MEVKAISIEYVRTFGKRRDTVTESNMGRHKRSFVENTNKKHETGCIKSQAKCGCLSFVIKVQPKSTKINRVSSSLVMSLLTVVNN